MRQGRFAGRLSEGLMVAAAALLLLVIHLQDAAATAGTGSDLPRVSRDAGLLPSPPLPQQGPAQPPPRRDMVARCGAHEPDMAAPSGHGNPAALAPRTASLQPRVVTAGTRPGLRQHHARPARASLLRLRGPPLPA